MRRPLSTDPPSELLLFVPIRPPLTRLRTSVVFWKLRLWETPARLKALITVVPEVTVAPPVRRTLLAGKFPAGSEVVV